MEMMSRLLQRRWPSLPFRRLSLSSTRSLLEAGPPQLEPQWRVLEEQVVGEADQHPLPRRFWQAPQMKAPDLVYLPDLPQGRFSNGIAQPVDDPPFGRPQLAVHPLRRAALVWGAPLSRFATSPFLVGRPMRAHPGRAGVGDRRFTKLPCIRQHMLGPTVGVSNDLGHHGHHLLLVVALLGQRRHNHLGRAIHGNQRAVGFLNPAAVASNMMREFGSVKFFCGLGRSAY